MKKIPLSILSFLFLSLVLKAQEVIPISKADVLQKVIEDNTSIKISEQEFIEARADYRQTNAVFLPNITASHTGITTTNPLMAFGSKLSISAPVWPIHSTMASTFPQICRILGTVIASNCLV